LSSVFKSKSVHIIHDSPFVPDNLLKLENSPKDSITDEVSVIDVQSKFVKEIDDVLQKAQHQSFEIIDKAHLQAQNILTNAEIQSDKIKEVASQKGFEQGYSEGLLIAEKKCLSLIEEITKVREMIIKERTILYDAAEQDLVNLSLEIARRAIYEHLSEDESAYLKLIQSTLQKVRGVDFVKLWVSPFDYALLLDLRDTILAGLKNIKDIEILSGDSIRKWGCLVDTESGVLDGGVETRLSQLEKDLRLTMGNLNEQ